MGLKLYVGNLPYAVTEEKLQEVFSRHGTVTSVRIITDKFTGRSKGFGFVEMGSEEEASQATQALHGNDLDGRALVVSEARPQEPRSSQGFRSGGRGAY